ncbi:neural cell adhesion molecule 2-like [Haliotis rubra]|uniref:neural cell adhesion molecule 2-like n=1 Tax=Haliotis rubra TaxID=36100 RepID=UPI001EE57945|nr:neural cell adhesion molecule 2-like [Haliotis rubra]
MTPEVIVKLHIFIAIITGIEGAVTVSGSGGTGIPNQQALTLRCSYTLTPGDVVTVFTWRKREGSFPVRVVTGSVSPQTTVFLDSWQNKGVFVGDYTSSLDIQLPASHVTSGHAGTYMCEVDGVSGSSYADVNATILYLDTPVLVFEKSEVTENDSLTLNCNVVSHPAAELTVRNIDNDTTLAEGDTNTISYTIQRVECLHNGTFVCSAYNRHTRTTTRASYDVDVLCAPRLDTRVPFISRLYRGLNEVASLKAAIVCNPPPVFKWLAYLDNQRIPIPNSTSHTVITSGQQSVLQVMVRQVSEYGKYSVEATNDVGRTQLVYTIAPAGAPLAPDETVIHNITSTSVWLQWQANFDGGSPQTFSVEYRASGSDWRVWKQGIPDPGQGKWLISHINSLKPNTEYMFQISARNIRGTSSKVVRDATTAGQETCSCLTQVSDRLGIGVGVGLGVALPMIISLAITSVVFLCIIARI